DDVAVSVTAIGEHPALGQMWRWCLEDDGEGVWVSPRRPVEVVELVEGVLGELAGLFGPCPPAGRADAVDGVPQQQGCVSATGAPDRRVGAAGVRDSAAECLFRAASGNQHT